jgi:two-component system chemotaxis response regulator CheY
MSYRFDRLKVLVIDDNLHMRRLVAAVLEAFGIKTVFEAENANDGWQIFRTEPWDLIFLDWVMDGMSGLEFAEKVRTSPDSPNPFVPIVMLTGHTSIERVNAARDAGINEFLAKPVSAKAIMNRLVAVIEHPRSFIRTKGYFGPCRRRRRDGAYQGAERRTCEFESQNTSSNAA